MRIKLTRVGLLVYLANHYTTRVAQGSVTCGKCWASPKPTSGNVDRVTANLISRLSSLTIVSNVSLTNVTYQLMFLRTLYNNNIPLTTIINIRLLKQGAVYPCCDANGIMVIVRKKWSRWFEYWTKLIAFHISLILWEIYESNYSPFSNG